MIEKTYGALAPYITVFGHNAATALAEETLSPRSALITIQPAITRAQLSSSSANDTAAGTGARTVRVHGLDAAFKRVTEDFTMNGQTAVLGSVYFTRVNHVEVLTVGTGLVNAGEVITSVRGAALTAGVPNTAADVISSILLGANVAWQAVFTVPAGEKYSLREFHITNRTQVDYILVKVRPFGGIFFTLYRYEFSATTDPADFYIPRGALVLSEKDDFQVNVIAGVAGGFCAAVFFFENMNYVIPRLET